MKADLKTTCCLWSWSNPSGWGANRSLGLWRMWCPVRLQLSHRSKPGSKRRGGVLISAQSWKQDGLSLIYTWFFDVFFFFFLWSQTTKVSYGHFFGAFGRQEAFWMWTTELSLSQLHFFKFSDLRWGPKMDLSGSLNWWAICKEQIMIIRDKKKYMISTLKFRP